MNSKFGKGMVMSSDECLFSVFNALDIRTDRSKNDRASVHKDYFKHPDDSGCLKNTGRYLYIGGGM